MSAHSVQSFHSMVGSYKAGGIEQRRYSPWQSRQGQQSSQPQQRAFCLPLLLVLLILSSGLI